MPSLSQSAIESLNSILVDAVDKAGFPGLSFAATDINGEIYHGTHGLRIINDPTGGPVTKDTVYWACSQTKLVAALAALHLVDQGKISLDTPIGNILPELANPIVLDDPSSAFSPTWKPAETKITLLQLMNHSSGLYYPDPMNLAIQYITPLDDEDPEGHFFRLIQGKYPAIPLAHQPGTNFAYGFSSDCLGIIIRRLTGKNLAEYSKEFIFEPLGMKSSFVLSQDMKEKLPSLCVRNEDGSVTPWDEKKPLTPREAGKVNLPFGGIGLFTTVTDYLTLLRHLLQIYAGVAKNPIWSANTIQGVFKPTLTETGAKTLSAMLYQDSQWSCAFHINVHDLPGRRPGGSGEWGGWAGTNYFIDPKTGVAAMLGTQVTLPIGPHFLGLIGQLEETLYAGLGNA